MKRNLINETYLQTVWRRFKHHHLAVVSIVVVAVISLAAILAPVLAPFDPQAIAGPFGAALSKEFFKEHLMRALENDPLDHFLICMATKKDPTGSFRIIYNAYTIIKR